MSAGLIAQLSLRPDKRPAAGRAAGRRTST